MDRRALLAVDVNRVTIRLVRPASGVKAAEKTFDFPAGQNVLDVSMEVLVSGASEDLELTILMIDDPSGDTVFRSGPDLITVQAGATNEPPAPQPVYVGVGANATGVRFVTAPATAFFGQTVNYVAEAVDANNNAIPNTPIIFSSADPTKASVPNQNAGSVVAGTTRGSTSIKAELLVTALGVTPASVTTPLLVQPVPSAVVLLSGGSQSGTVGTPLPVPVVVRVNASDNLPVQGATVNWTVLSGGGSVSAPSSVTSAAGDASVSWTLGGSAGAQSIGATVTGATPAPLTVPATGNVAAATKLSWIGVPPTTPVNGTIAPPLQVAAQDAFNNTVPSFAGSISVAIGTNPGGATLNGTTTVAPSGGIATFNNLSLTSPGTGYTLVASATGLTSATSAAFNVTGQVATKLAFTVQPTGTTVSTPISPAIQVTVQDAGGATVTGAGNTVTLSIANNPGGATLGGTLSVAAVNGIATFPGITLSAAGTGYTLSAAATGLAGATSTAFDIGAAAPSLRTWTGTVSTSWTTAGNWNPASVPGTSSDVVIPGGTPNQPVLTSGVQINSLTVAPTGTVSVGLNVLVVTGNLDASGPIVGSGGQVQMAPAQPATLRGVLPTFRTTNPDVITLNGTVSVVGNVQIGSGAELVLNSNAFGVSGSFTTTSGGLLRMTGAADALSVSGGVIFDGGDETGKLSAGAITVGGNFTQSAGTTNNSFVSTGTHVLLFGSTAPTTISFASSGTLASRFADLTLAGSQDVTLNGFLYASGDVAVVTPIQFGTVASAADLVVGGTLTTAPGSGLKLQQLAINADSLFIGGNFSTDNVLFTGGGVVPVVNGYNNVSVRTGRNTTASDALSLAGRLTVETPATVFTLGPGEHSAAHLTVQANGALTLGGGSLAVQDAATSSDGRLTMNDPGDSLDVSAGIVFDGASEASRLTDGVIVVRGGDFVQQASTSPQSFVSGGTRVRFENGGPVNIQMATAPPAAFAQIELAGPGTVTLLQPTFASGRLRSLGTSSGLASAGHRLEVAGLDVDGLTISNTQILSTGGTLTRFDNVDFSAGYTDTFTPLVVRHAGATVTFNGVTFGNTNPGAQCMLAEDLTPGAPVLAITMAGSTPSDCTAGTTLVGGATVTWQPAPATRTWTGAVSTDWSNSANWNGGVVPGTNDDASIAPAGGFQPTLTAPVTVRNVTVFGTGAVLTIGGRTLTVNGNLVVHTGGLLEMINTADRVEVFGDAAFDGGNQTGRLTAGELRLHAGFNQSSTSSNRSFFTSGSHRTVMLGTQLQSVTFCCSSPVSGFQNLDLSNSAGINIQFNGFGVLVNDTLISLPGGPNPRLYMLGSPLQARRVRVNGLIVDRGTLTINEGGVAANQQFDNVTFENYLTSQTQLTMFVAGGARTLTFNNLHFQPLTTGNTGRYLNISGSGATLDLPGATPANGPLFTSASGVTVNWPASAAIWTGAVSTAWNVGGNWLAGTVPGTTDNVLIPGGQPRQPGLVGTTQVASIEVAAGGLLDIGNFVLTVTGDLDASGVIFTAGSSFVEMNPTRTVTLRGNVPQLHVLNMGIVNLTGPLSVAGRLNLAGSLGEFRLNGWQVGIVDQLNVGTGARVRMTNAGDRLTVGGTATFGGGDQTGLLTAGVIELQSDFRQINGQSALSFVSTGTDVLFSGSIAQQVDLENTSGTRFHDIEFANADDLTLLDNITATGRLVVTSGTPRVIGNGNTLNVAGLDVAGLVLDNGTIRSTGGTLTRFDNVTFINQDPAASQLFISHPGSATPFAIKDASFQVTPTSGFYLDIVDSDGANGQAFTVDVVNPTPNATPAQIRAAGGAVIHWPAIVTAVTRTWTGAVSSDWSDPANWSPGGVPAPIDDVVIAFVQNDAELTDDATIHNLTVAPGANLVVSDVDLEVTGSVDNAGFVNGSGGVVLLTGSGETVHGSFEAMQIAGGVVTLSGDLSVSDNLNLVGTAELVVGGHHIAAQQLFTNSGAVLTMTNAADSVDVATLAQFVGGDETGHLTAGVLAIGSAFSQAQGQSTRSFASTGTRLRLNGTGTQTVIMNTSSATDSRLADFIVATDPAGNPQVANFKVMGNVVFETPVTMSGFSGGGSLDINGQLVLAQGSSLILNTLTINGSNIVNPAPNFPSAVSANTMNYTGGAMLDKNHNTVNVVQGGQVTGPVGPNRVVTTVTVSGTGSRLTLAGNLIAGNTTVSGGGELVLAGHFYHAAQLNVNGSSNITLTNAADSLAADAVNLSATSDGAGHFSAGVISVLTAFAANGSNSFPSTGTRVRLMENQAQTVTMAGSSATTNRFRDLIINKTAGAVTLSSDANGMFVTDSLAIQTATNVTGNIVAIAPTGHFRQLGGTYNAGLSVNADSMLLGGGTFNPFNMTFTGGATLPTRTYSSLIIQTGGTMSLAGNITTGPFAIRGAGTNLRLNGHTWTTNANTGNSISNGATIEMTNPADVLNAFSLSFLGGDETGLLTAGQINVAASFSQQAPTTPLSFVSSGTRVRFTNTTAGRTISMATPAASGGSHFQDIEFAGTTPIALNSTVLALGQLISPAGAQTINAGGNILQSAGLDVDGLTFDNVRLFSIDGTLTRFDNVTFTGYPADQTILTVSHPGTAPVTFNNVVWSDPVTAGGFYLSAIDNTANANGLDITLGGTSGAPGGSGPSFTQVAGGAQVHWPVTAAAITWTGATSSSWFTGSNWSGGAVPLATDDVIIPAGTPNGLIVTGAPQVHNVTVQPTATMTIGGSSGLHASGSVDAGTTVVGTGVLFLEGAATSLRGTVANVTVTGGVTASGPLTVTGNVLVTGSAATFSPGSQHVTVQNNLIVQNDGLLVMTNPAGQLDVNAAQFSGGDETGRLTAGILRIAQDFAQANATSPFSFASSGTRVILNGSTHQEISFESPGSSRFADLFINMASGDVNFGTQVFIGDSLAVFSATVVNAGSASPLLVTRKVKIPVGATLAVHALVANADSLDIQGTFAVTSLALNGGTVLPSLPYQDVSVIAGTLTNPQPVTVAGALSLSGTATLTLGANLAAQTAAVQGGNLVLNGHLLSVSNAFVTGNTGRLVMTNPNDSLDVSSSGSSIFFGGGDETGQLSAGAIVAGGGFLQLDTFSASSFASTGTRVRLVGSDQQDIGLSSPSLIQSRFRDLIVNKPSGPVTLNGDIAVSGNLSVVSPTSVSGGFAIMLNGTSSLTTAAGSDLAVSQLFANSGNMNIGGSYNVADTHYQSGTAVPNLTYQSLALEAGGTMSMAAPVVLQNLTLNNATELVLPATPVSVGGVVAVQNGSRLTMGGSALTIAGQLRTETGGILQMTNAGDSVDVTGFASFDGGDETGQLTAGVINLRGNMGQANTTSNASFVSAGTHRTRLSGGAGQTINFLSAGQGAGSSHFNELFHNNLSLLGVTTTSLVVVNGQFHSIGLRGWQGQGHALVIGGADINDLSFDNTLVLVDTLAAFTQFNNVNFTGYSNNVTQLEVRGRANETKTFNALTFFSAPTTGFYVDGRWMSGTGTPFEVRLNGANPATHGGHVVANLGPAGTANISNWLP